MSGGEAPEWLRLRDWSSRTARLHLSDSQLDRLHVYLDLLLLWNRKLALVSQQEPGAILAKHVADSLFVAAQCRADDAVVDLGSGGGFPGLVIAIVRAPVRMCLIESRGRKASFLEEAARAIGARNVEVCNARIETVAAAPAHHGQYSVATCRALGSTLDFLRLATPLLGTAGRAIAMRSCSEDRSREPPGAEQVEYPLPDGSPRRLLIYRGVTPADPATP